VGRKEKENEREIESERVRRRGKLEALEDLRETILLEEMVTRG